MRALYKLLLVLCVGVGVILGALADRYPTWAVTRHQYCTLCGVHRVETVRTPLLGRTTTVDDHEGLVFHLLSPVVGDHVHAFSAAAYVHPTNPSPHLTGHDAFAQAVSEAEVRDLEKLEESPHLVALLDEGMRHDRARATRLLQRLLDPTAHLGVEVVSLLDRSAPWETRWAIVDAFFASYHCDETDASVSCRLRTGSTDLILLVRTASTVHTGGIEWARWTPPGFVPPSSAASTYAAVN